jgi:hypothetical protein
MGVGVVHKKKSRFSASKIVNILKEAEAGASGKNLDSLIS